MLAYYEQRRTPTAIFPPLPDAKTGMRLWYCPMVMSRTFLGQITYCLMVISRTSLCLWSRRVLPFTSCPLLTSRTVLWTRHVPFYGHVTFCPMVRSRTAPCLWSRRVLPYGNVTYCSIVTSPGCCSMLMSRTPMVGSRIAR
jgi:hypothetical protein